MDEGRASVVRCACINSAALVPMIVLRKLRGTRGSRPGRRAEDAVPWSPLNRLLRALYVGPACWRWFRPPAGAGLILILRRRV